VLAEQEDRMVCGRYRLARVLGAGRTSVVHVAEDLVEERAVALKVLRRAAGPVRHELAALQALRLSEVVRLLDDGVDERGRRFLVMDLVEGLPFPAGAASWAELRPVLVGLLRGLRCLHANGIVHRDLKPAHVLVTDSLRPVLIDFGIASGDGVLPSRDADAEIAGTLRYAAPEQLVDATQADARSDLFAVGLMIAEVLTGRIPHDHDDPARLRQQRLQGSIPAFDEALPHEARALLEGLLPRKRRRRLASADEALAILGEDAATECDAAFAHWQSAVDRRGLERLFAGPERLFHLRSDLARELSRRGHGAPRRTAEVLSAWIRHGVARWDRGALLVTRHDLSRLQGGLRLYVPPAAPRGTPPLPRPLELVLGCIHVGWPDTGQPTLVRLTGLPKDEVERHCRSLQRLGWIAERDGQYELLQLPMDLRGWLADALPEIHGAIAATLPRRDARKLFHLSASGQAMEVAPAALSQAREALRRGQLGWARFAIEQGLRSARQIGDPVAEAELLQVLLQVSLTEDTRRGFAHMLYELHRSTSPTAGLEALVRAARAVHAGALGEVSDHLQRVPPMASEEVDRWNWAIRIRLVFRSAAPAEEVLAGARQWAEDRGTPTALADVLGWEGLIAYDRGDVARAAELHGLAAEGKVHGTGRLSSRGNQAAALLEVPDLDRASNTARVLLAEAAVLRHPVHEAFAEWILAVASYRSGASARPDWELVEAARHLDACMVQGQLIFQAAVQAWRSQDLRSAHALAAESARSWAGDGRIALRTLPKALALACADAPSAREAEALAAPLLDGNLALPGIALQDLGVLAWRFPGLRSHWRDRMHELAALLPESLRIGRRELMTVEEALVGIHTLPTPAMED